MRRLSANAALGCAGLLVLAALLMGFLAPAALWRHLPLILYSKSGVTPIPTHYGGGMAGAARFSATVLALGLGYGAALWAARRGAAAPGAAAFCVLFAAVMMGAVQNGDVYSYLAQGRLCAHYHENPLVVAPAAHPADPFLARSRPWAAVPSRYGPAWAGLACLAVAAGGEDWVRDLLALKVVAVLGYLAALPLVHALGRRIHPRGGTAAVVLLGWNPLVLFNVLGDAHHDLVMMAPALGALLLAAQRRWRWVWPLLALSVLVKYVTLLLAPPLLVWSLRQGREAWRPTAEGLALGAVVAVLGCLPVWDGPRTFAALRQGGGWVIHSPAALLGRLVPGRTGAIQAGLAGAFALVYGHAVYRARQPDVEGLLRACLQALLAYVVLLAYWFWPWYLIWAAAVAAPLGMGWPTAVVALLSFTGMCAETLFIWRGELGMTDLFSLPYLAAFLGVLYAPPVVLWLVMRRRGK